VPSARLHDGEPCLDGSDCASLNCNYVSADGGTCTSPQAPAIGCTGRLAAGGT
jgi:hypothetical protein